MNIDPQTANAIRQAGEPRRVYLKLAVVMLLVAIAGFATVAKNSQYYSRSNPAHYINISSKMTVGHLSVVIDRTPLRPIARFVPPQPEMRVAKLVEEEILALPSVSVAVSLQHRSPPLVLS